MTLKRVVITGLGAVTPIGNTIPEFWDSVVNGKSGAAPITGFNTETILTKTKFACEVKNFDLSLYMDRKEARKVDKYTHFAIGAAVQAIEDASIDKDKENPDRIGVVLGVGLGGVESFGEGIDAIYEQKKNGQELKVTPFFIPRIIGDMAAGYISIMYGFSGPNYITSSACASGTNAVIDAINLIRLGKADIIITGGTEAAVTDSGICGFNAMHALSTRNDSPETASRPLSASRDGFVLGEGAGILVLEEYEHAVARGAKIYAEVAGWGLSADAYHMTAPEPDGKGAVKVMQNALEDAGLKPEDIDYINMHGTSTPLGDIVECKAIKSVFGDHSYKMNISATKSMTGHLLGAAGAIEAIICVLSIVNNIVPPTINHQDDDMDENIDYNMNFTFNKAQERVVNTALSNTFGFGGHNACIILKKYSE
ncbi:MAG: beta-ketoacyl-ACP synthase II [Bacteroidaceae bacterium]|nr:beta-ketoacyl-ACP synthase II [Bacteroidaceae bacterium]MBO5951748.1 beta-ketoacyl-ACP synthase II [Bacteroidaceae bacterium]